MSDYCVVIRGRLPDDRDDRDDLSIWAPIASSLHLDQTTFASRVLAALPLIVRRQLGQDAAAALVVSLEQAGVNACAVPDDTQLVYLERDGTTRGPVPLSALARFIQPGERFRLRNTQDWKTWPSAEALTSESDEALPEPPAADAAALDLAQPDDHSTTTTPTPAGDAISTSSDHDVAAPVETAEPNTAPVDSPPPALSPTLPPDAPSMLLPEDPDRPENPGESVARIDREPDGDPAEPGAGIRLLLPVGRTGLSIAAGYLGLLAVIPFIAPLTLIVSILAWRDLKRRPEKHGSGRILFGLIMGVGMTILLVIGVAVGYRSAKTADVGLKAPVPTRSIANTSGGAGSPADKPVMPSSTLAAPAASVEAAPRTPTSISASKP